MITNFEFVEYVRTWLGCPWKHQGRSRFGVDCVGLVINACEYFNIPHQDFTGYRREGGIELVRIIKQQTLPCTPTIPVHGGLAVFHDSVSPCHVGVFDIEDSDIYVIHACAHPHRRVIKQPYLDGNISLCNSLTMIRKIKGVNYVG